MADLHYRVEVAAPERHRFRVTLRIGGKVEDGQKLALAAWTPGSYMIRDFARNVVSLSVRNDDGAQQAQKLDKQTWQLTAGSGTEVVYEIHAWDPSVRAAYLDLERGFFDGACMFLRVAGMESEPAVVELVAPEDSRCASWMAATAMPGQRVGDQGFGTFQVADYFELVDHPVEYGCFQELAWQVGDVPHRMVLSGRFHMDEMRLKSDLEKICATEIKLFGEAPFPDYLFMTNVTGSGYGGLEHRSSTALICTRASLPAPGLQTADDKYREFLGLCSHEYFHSWNVKRIRPAAFARNGLDAEVYTELLWVFEGFTSYYDDLILVRSGVIESTSYLELLGQIMTRVLRCAGRKGQTVAESSFDAWTRFYKQDACAPNLIISYYAKGALVALALDLFIRRETGHAKSLDDVMRFLWQEHGVPNRGLEDDAMPALIQSVTGVVVDAEIMAWVHGTEDPPLEDLLAAHGVEVNLRAECGMSDRGGKAPAESTRAARPVLGLRCETEQGFARVCMVFDDSPAGKAGLAPDDLVIACDGMRLRAEEIDAFLSRRTAGESVRIHYLRQDILLEAEIELEAGPETTVWLEVSDDSRLEKWLSRPSGQ